MWVFRTFKATEAVLGRSYHVETPAVAVAQTVAGVPVHVLYDRPEPVSLSARSEHSPLSNAMRISISRCAAHWCLIFITILKPHT